MCEGSIPINSNIIYLADRVAALAEITKDYILNIHQDIISKIAKNSGTLFNPKVVKAFLKVSKKESFWLDMQSDFLIDLVHMRRPKQNIRVSATELVNIVKCFSSVIDNKSPYTRKHSERVALVVEFLANKVGFSDSELIMIKIAGYLHDLGKVSIPNRILDKPSKLTTEEFAIIKKHTYYSYYLLQNINGFELVAKWGSYHHEKLDGSGYPFHLKRDNLPLGSRLMAVADIFSALTEDWSYREGMGKEQCLAIIKKLGTDNTIDELGVNLVEEHYDELLTLTRPCEG